MSAPSPAVAAFARYAAGCPNRIEIGVERRPGNALNVEIGTPLPRCRLRPPSHWPASASAGRWLASGGSALVFGPCSRGSCPLRPQHCEACGHMADSHLRIAGRVSCVAHGDGFPCGCDAAPSPRVIPGAMGATEDAT